MRNLDYYKYSRNGTFLSVHFSKCTLTVMPILLYNTLAWLDSEKKQILAGGKSGFLVKVQM